MRPLALYVDSARRMRAEQLIGRVRRALPPNLLAAGTAGAAPPFVPNARGLGIDRAPQSGPTPPPEATGHFGAVGRSRAFPARDFWTDESGGLLFLFHLHGFRPLAAYAAGPRTEEGDAFWSAVVEDWLEVCARPANPAWHPYPTSDRVISWAAALSAGDWPFAERLRAELWREVRYLTRALERDIGGNHLLKNAAAIAIAGSVFPEGRALDRGLTLVEREVERQFLGDGGHEERSPAYHRELVHLLADVATAAERARGAVPGWLSSALGRARGWLAAIAGPDGSLPLLNDAWDGPPEDARAAEGVTVLRESGHVVIRDAGAQAVIDAGPLAPPHLPPHAHADALSFVLWWDGRPLVADRGSYLYTGPERDAFRGTAAHNTVAVDGADQCRFWGDFRLANPPNVRLEEVRDEGETVVVVASHDGYRRLADPVVHRRTFVWLRGEGMVVVDRLECGTAHRIRSALHLHPEAGAPALELRPIGADAREEGYAYAPYLGTRVGARALVDERAVEPGEPFGWTLLPPGRRAAVAEGRLELTGGPGPARTVALG